jgi:hypothetical protein
MEYWCCFEFSSSVELFDFIIFRHSTPQWSECFSIFSIFNNSYFFSLILSYLCFQLLHQIIETLCEYVIKLLAKRLEYVISSQVEENEKLIISTYQTIADWILVAKWKNHEYSSILN